MTNDQIKNLIMPLLREAWGQSGFSNATVESETDFDGNPIIRIVAEGVPEDISAERLLEAQHKIRSLLLERGDDRFVFLDAAYPQDEFVDEEFG